MFDLNTEEDWEGRFYTTEAVLKVSFFFLHWVIRPTKSKLHVHILTFFFYSPPLPYGTTFHYCLCGSPMQALSSGRYSYGAHAEVVPACRLALCGMDNDMPGVTSARAESWPELLRVLLRRLWTCYKHHEHHITFLPSPPLFLPLLPSPLLTLVYPYLPSPLSPLA